MTEPSGIFEGHERRERGNNEVSGIQRNKEPPTGTFVRAPMSVSLVNFRSFAQKVASDGSFIDFEPREVTFVDAYHKELPESSKISFAGQESTLPMAFDNQRFFQGDDGYQDLLNQASREMDEIGLTGDAWREPAKEMGLLGWLWRMVVKFLMWLTNDAVNRLRFTRGIQDALPFQSAYESFAVGGVVRAFDVDDRGQDDFNLKLCFKNRNASRVLVQNLSRWDRVWHLGTQITWSRSFDMFGRLPFIGFTGFPATENFASTRTLAIRGTVRLLFQGSWLARYLSGNQQANVTLDSGTAAQNLAAEGGSSSEASNRNQFGTYIGREKTNGFRFEHRLSVDESIVRTFVTNPASTMVNNGVEHVLRCLAKHWRNMLYQENGNFAHQRMEQLNPFETLRFHMPIVLSVLANLRGRNVWDTTTLGPFIKRLERLNPEKIKRRADVENGNDALDEIYGPCQAAKAIVEELVSTILPNVCGGVPSRVEPFEQWLSAMRDAIDELCSEAETVKEFVSSVDIGIKLGYQLLRLVDWRVPTEGRMANAVVDFILDSKTLYPDVPRELINSALHKLNSKDERTVKELVKQGLRKVEAATLLIGRTCTLLEREFRRKALDERILKLAKGPVTTSDTLEKKKWYWVDTKEGSRVVVFRGAVGSHIKVVDVETNIEQLLEGGPGLSIREYIPIAEAISRAQKVFMIIEVDYGKKFPYNAFMEFGSSENPDSLRFRLRRLVILSQVQCSALDQARLNVLAEIKSSVQQIRTSSKFEASRLVAECKPQNATFLGGGALLFLPNGNAFFSGITYFECVLTLFVCLYIR